METSGMWGSRVLALLGSQDLTGSWFGGTVCKSHPLSPSWVLPPRQPSRVLSDFSHAQHCPVSPGSFFPPPCCPFLYSLPPCLPPNQLKYMPRGPVSSSVTCRGWGEGWTLNQSLQPYECTFSD